MYPSSVVLWCHMLLFVAPFSYSLGNSTNNDEQRNNLTVHDFFVNSVKDQDDEMQQYRLHENSTKNDNDTQYESHINSNDSEYLIRYYEHILKFYEEDDQMFMTSRVNSTEISDTNDSTLRASDKNLMKIGRENNSISDELYENMTSDDYNSTMVTIVSHEACENKTCIQLCCPFGDRLTSEKKCVAGQTNYSFPDVYQNGSEKRKLNELFQLTVRNPCILQRSAHRVLDSNEYSFLVNGSVYLDRGELISSTSYCLAILDRDIYNVIACMIPVIFPAHIPICLLVSLPFLLLTFVVYSILPEVQNVHNYTLRVYIASLFIINLIIFLIQQFPELSERKYCVPLAYIFNMAMLSSCFWLNATCFDIWWTFRKLTLHPLGIKKKQKLVIYSIYAWGMTIGFTIACAIMDYTPGIPKNLIRPEMCIEKFWLGGDSALTVYYYAPTGIAFISNICLFVATALAILYHNKHTAGQLRDSESRRYDKKKRKFNMYLKLFIVMGLSWSMGIVLWMISTSASISLMVWSISYTIDILQGVIIFILYVCKKKILWLLLKRFGWHRKPFWNISMNTQRTKTSSLNTSYLSSTSTSEDKPENVPMQEMNPSVNQQTNLHVEPKA